MFDFFTLLLYDEIKLHSVRASKTIPTKTFYRMSPCTPVGRENISKHNLNDFTLLNDVSCL